MVGGQDKLSSGRQGKVVDRFNAIMSVLEKGAGTKKR